jgi:hypothetical protein
LFGFVLFWRTFSLRGTFTEGFLLCRCLSAPARPLLPSCLRSASWQRQLTFISRFYAKAFFALLQLLRFPLFSSFLIHRGATYTHCAQRPTVHSRVITFTYLAF